MQYASERFRDLIKAAFGNRLHSTPLRLDSNVTLKPPHASGHGPSESDPTSTNGWLFS